MESSVLTVTVRTVLTIWNMKRRDRKQSNNVLTEIHKHSILKLVRVTYFYTIFVVDTSRHGGMDCLFIWLTKNGVMISGDFDLNGTKLAANSSLVFYGVLKTTNI